MSFLSSCCSHNDELDDKAVLDPFEVTIQEMEDDNWKEIELQIDESYCFADHRLTGVLTNSGNNIIAEVLYRMHTIDDINYLSDSTKKKTLEDLREQTGKQYNQIVFDTTLVFSKDSFVMEMKSAYNNKESEFARISGSSFVTRLIQDKDTVICNSLQPDFLYIFKKHYN